MFDAYKVAVKLTLVNGVSAGLVGLSSQFQKLSRDVGQTQNNIALLERKLLDIKRLGLIGGAITGAGVGMLFSLKGPVEQAMEYGREVSKLQQMGLGDKQIAEARKFSEATEIIGTSMQQRMRLFVEAQGSFRESGMEGSKALAAAKIMMPVLAQYEVASGLLGGETKARAQGSMRSLNKIVEIMGGLNDVERAKSIADGVFKAVQSSGKMVDERQLKQFVAYGGSATNQLGIRAIFGGLEPMIGELGGSTAAVGLRTAYTRMNGMMSLPPHLLLSEMSRLGMADFTGRKQKDDLARLEATDVPAYISKVMGIYKTHGITSVTDRERENAILFGTNGSKVINLLMRQMPVIAESLKSYDLAHGISQTVSDNKDSPLLAIQKFHAAMSDLGLVIGQTVLPVLTPMLKSLTEFFKELGHHPDMVRNLTRGFIGLAAAMSIGGTLMLTTSAFKALGMAMTFGGVGGVGGVAGIRAVAAAIGGAGAGSLVFALGALGVAVWGLSKILTAVGGDGVHDPLNHPGKKFMRHGRGAGNGEWVVDPTQSQEHAGQHWVPGSRAGGGRWDNDTGGGYVAPKSQRQTATINNTIVMPDGKVLANVVTKEQSKSAERGMFNSVGYFDPSMSLAPVGH